MSKVLKDLGAEIISADELGHEAYRRGTEGWRQVVREFGESVLKPGGEVDRSKLGAVVFGDDHALSWLTAIVHPGIRRSVEERVRELEEQGREVAVIEAALLLEAGWATLVDEVWVTVASIDQVVERVQSRDSLGSDAIRARMESQMLQADRLAHADAVIDNNGSLDELRDRVHVIWNARVCRSRKRKPRK